MSDISGLPLLGLNVDLDGSCRLRESPSSWPHIPEQSCRNMEWRETEEE